MFPPIKMRQSFGRCVLDTATRELTVDGAVVHLPLKIFQLLEVLLECRPRALSKAELHERLWPGTFVSEAALSSLVADLRAAIGDTARESGLIRTVHKYGYAFGGQVSVVSDGRDAMPTIRLIWGARELALHEGENLLGRIREAVVWVDDPGVSRRHARINVHGTAATLEDLGSKNGTFLNELEIRGTEPLADGDTIVVGPATLTLRVCLMDRSTRTAGVRRWVPSAK